ncbi:Beta-phosphoglucomutase [Hexamita inflata]|uniref:Beta-phosphoglucomutase n=1 Tax=Hexamita inflata TaxID=28002 RepID=A0AA86TV98_9EUKA|nr:Beta-phosphoglucomutase [Hexamita inflata]CAI9940558.1 Beta-phosphoglucomutase [Hexamita inflata]
MSNEIMKNIEYVVFDFDGTLALTSHIWMDINGHVLKLFGVSTDLYHYAGCIAGKTMGDVAKYTIQKYEIQATEQDLINQWTRLGTEAYSKCDFVPYADSFINLLYSSGIKMGIATASPRHMIESFFTRFPEIRKKIDIIVTCDEVKANKPDPTVFIQCMKQLGCQDSSKCAIFEDSIMGLKGAKAAGANVICVLTEQGKIEEKNELSNFSIPDYQQLI